MTFPTGANPGALQVLRGQRFSHDRRTAFALFLASVLAMACLLIAMPGARAEDSSSASGPAAPATQSDKKADWVALGQGGKIYYSLDRKEFLPANVPADTPTLYGVCYALKHFVAVGDRGAILTSPNGIDWTAEKSGVDTALRAVAYGREKYVAVGDGGVILYSVMGKTWKPVDSGTTQNLRLITFTRSVRAIRFFTAAGDNGALLTSRMGDTTWTEHKGVTKENFVALTGLGAGRAITPSGTIYVSEDDYTWTADPTSLGMSPVGVVTGKGLFMAADASGNIAITNDFGKTWQRAGSVKATVTSLMYADDVFVVTGPDLFATSPDGNEWTRMKFPEGAQQLGAVTSFSLANTDEEPQQEDVLRTSREPEWVKRMPAPIRNNMGYVFATLAVVLILVTIYMFRETKAKPKETRRLAPGERAELPPLPLDSPILKVFENTNPMRVRINTGPYHPFVFSDPWLIVDEINLDLTDAEPVYKSDGTKFLLNNRSMIEFKEVEYEGKRSMWDT
ncbi:MAG: WD40/YVTN/BNR-like repeat-containing protein [Candidatus Methylacidiphilales bacterium]|nr:hypothetical protein [Candidatus Methylacidiphilales bacterium]